MTIGVSPGDGTLTAATAGGALALYNNSSNNLTINSAIADNSSASPLYTFGTGVTVLNASNTYTGTTGISGGSLVVNGTGSLGNNGVYAAAIANNGSLVFSTSSAQTLSGVMSGNGSLVALGPGTLTMSAPNTFNGGVTISGATVSVNSVSTGGTAAAALGEGPANASGQSIALNGAMLTYTGGNTVANPTANALAFNPNITLNSGGGTINNAGSGYLGFSGTLSGAGNLTIIDLADTERNTGQSGHVQHHDRERKRRLHREYHHRRGRKHPASQQHANLLGTMATVTINPGGISLPTTVPPVLQTCPTRSFSAAARLRTKGRI